ncbi:MAG TPA: pseudouridine synthase [Thermomicrobiales bacterium]|nr:pseudouridine synthase [Thermomicrobiales bacterium]
MERLQRVMAARGGASRRASEALIREGRVTVDGQLVTQLGTKVDPEKADIRVDGRPLRRQRTRTLMLNKPSGYITTTSDERDRWTVMDLVQVPERVYPVGRLDRDTEGLLLFTNDGELANRIMHPRFGLAKEYHVLTPSRPDDRTMQRVRDGVMVDDVLLVPEEFRLLRETRDGFLLKIVLHVGIQHVVRRMMEAVRIPVERLRRVRIGPLTIEGIPRGTWRELTPGETLQLSAAVKLDQPAPRVGGRPSRPNPVPRPGSRRQAPPVAPRARQGEPMFPAPRPPAASVSDPLENAAARPTPDRPRRRRGEPPAPLPRRRREERPGTGPTRRAGGRKRHDDSSEQRENELHGRRRAGSPRSGHHRRPRRGRKDDGRAPSR